MELNLKITGILLILLALIHIKFPKYFNWPGDLQGVSLINRQMMYVHTLFIALVLVLMGALCLTSAGDIIHTSLGHRLSLGLAIFWAVRLVIQIFGYSPKLWKGKRFETMVHISFLLIWTYFVVVFTCAYFMNPKTF